MCHELLSRKEVFSVSHIVLYLVVRSQLQTGLFQLSEARVLIRSMQQELEILKPEIEVKSEV